MMIWWCDVVYSNQPAASWGGRRQGQKAPVNTTSALPMCPTCPHRHSQGAQHAPTGTPGGLYLGWLGIQLGSAWAVPKPLLFFRGPPMMEVRPGTGGTLETIFIQADHPCHSPGGGVGGVTWPTLLGWLPACPLPTRRGRRPHTVCCVVLLCGLCFVCTLFMLCCVCAVFVCVFACFMHIYTYMRRVLIDLLLLHMCVVCCCWFALDYYVFDVSYAFLCIHVCCYISRVVL